VNEQVKNRRYSIGQIMLEFLGSMNLAITVLVAIAIASVIGTILRQNQDYTDYIIKFGPFWHDMFEYIGLYDVYSVWWFMALIAFLITSTSVCIYRNGPNMFRDMRNYRTHAKRNSLLAFHNTSTLQLDEDREQIVNKVGNQLVDEGFKFRVKEEGDHTLFAAMHGGINRLGYIFTHVAIVVIVIGAMIDKNIWLSLSIASGDVVIETQPLAASKFPEESILSTDNPAFRGSVSIPEGQSANIAFINIRDGSLVQELPFNIQLADFRIEHYKTGQPKSFESDLVIRDDNNGEVVKQTIAVNYPLIYNGYTIYQASFSDGGTKMKFKAWPLKTSKIEALDINLEVFDNITIDVDKEPFKIELNDFRKFNINPVVDKDGKEDFKNFGPNFTYKLRDARGQAREYQNYMSPIEQEGSFYFVSGVRNSVAEEFRYLYMPMDSNGSMERFLRLHAAVLDADRVKVAVERTVSDWKETNATADEKLIAGITKSAYKLLGLFGQGGIGAISDHVKKTVNPEQQTTVYRVYIEILRSLVGNLYVQLLADEGVNLDDGISDADSKFFDDALTSLSDLDIYGAPFYLQLIEFEQIQASGLQIAKSPGKDIFYFGSVMLIIGIFMMFYIHNRRCWVWIGKDKSEQGYEVIVAGTSNRNEREFAINFAHMRDRFAARFGIESEK